MKAIPRNAASNKVAVVMAAGLLAVCCACCSIGSIKLPA